MTIEADPDRLTEARDWALQAAADAGMAEPDCFQVKLAMSEAVANAIEHGSSARSDRIRIEAFERDGSLFFEIRDTGTFSAPIERPATTFDDESGRGLEVVSMMMDHVGVTSLGGGTVLQFAKRLG